MFWQQCSKGPEEGDVLAAVQQRPITRRATCGISMSTGTAGIQVSKILLRSFVCSYHTQTAQSLAGSSRQMIMILRMTATIAKVLTDILSGMQLTLPWMILPTE